MRTTRLIKLTLLILSVSAGSAHASPFKNKINIQFPDVACNLSDYESCNSKSEVYQAETKVQARGASSAKSTAAATAPDSRVEAAEAEVVSCCENGEEHYYVLTAGVKCTGPSVEYAGMQMFSPACSFNDHADFCAQLEAAVEQAVRDNLLEQARQIIEEMGEEGEGHSPEEILEGLVCTTDCSSEAFLCPHSPSPSPSPSASPSSSPTQTPTPTVTPTPRPPRRPKPRASASPSPSSSPR